MIISSIAKFNAINTMNNSAYSLMTYSDNLVNLNSFSGMQSNKNLDSIFFADKKLTQEIIKNQLLYKTSSAQAKSLDKMA